jgi:glycosyltransferase involved in cell wall biosynthesis
MYNEKKPRFNRIAFIGNYLPRQCGIATFTTDLCEAMAAEFPDTNWFALPVNDTAEGYDYPPRVRFEIVEQEIASYQRAADFLNIKNVDLVCLQHEYGIFGGASGSHILALLRDLRMPIVSTLHTIIYDPDPIQRKVMGELVQLSDRLAVMNQRSAQLLQGIYKVTPEKIAIIPHGIPDMSFVDPSFYKDQFGVEGKQLLLTFGLLSSNKGIENVIKALPEIVSRYPKVVYIVLGATHPHVKRAEGESYRLFLQRLARELGVESNVIFHNRFVSLEELIEFIGAADIYLTPYLNPAQIVSGTLAYTLGAGKAIISTPYLHAEELLAEGRGLLVPFGDAAAIASQVLTLLDNETERHAIRKRAYMYSREMIWPRVAQRYMDCFEKAREERSRHPRPAGLWTLDKRRGELPLLKLDQLHQLTDDTGILQHAVYDIPNYDEGYATDDNARALVAAVLMEEVGGKLITEARTLASRYLAFLWHAFAQKDRRFRNFFTYDRKWENEAGSEDSHGRALWSLGMVLGRSNHEGLRGVAGRLFSLALPPASEFTSPRAWAFALIGIHEYLRRYTGDRAVQSAREALAEKLMDLYRANSSPAWPWFEIALSYDNAKLCHAMLLSGQWMSREEMSEAGLKSLEWLVSVQRAKEGHFAPIGSNGFYPKGGEKARFDQQPIEVHAVISASLEAHRMTGDERWHKEAQLTFDWFLGRNDLHLPLYDSKTGGCHDGLHSDRMNQNQGAESTLAFLLSLLEMQLSENTIMTSKNELVNERSSRKIGPTTAEQSN